MNNFRLVRAVVYKQRLMSSLPDLEADLVVRLQSNGGAIVTGRYIAQRDGIGYRILRNEGRGKYVQLQLFKGGRKC